MGALGLYATPKRIVSRSTWMLMVMGYSRLTTNWLVALGSKSLIGRWGEARFLNLRHMEQSQHLMLSIHLRQAAMQIFLLTQV